MLKLHMHYANQVKGISKDNIFLEKASLSIRKRSVNCQGPGS